MIFFRHQRLLGRNHLKRVRICMLKKLAFVEALIDFKGERWGKFWCCYAHGSAPLPHI